MVTFTINEDNNITAFARAEEVAQAGDATKFDSQASLAKISVEWPLRRFVAIWNSIPGNTEVKKFADRKKAVARIWKAIQPLAGHDGSAAEPEVKPKNPAQAQSPRRRPSVRKRRRLRRRPVTGASAATRRRK